MKITQYRLMEIIKEEIAEALDPHRPLLKQKGKYQEPEGDLPAALSLATAPPPKEVADPYPIYPSARAMMLAMDWYRNERPEKYKNFIKEKGSQEELDQINRSIMGAAREIDAAQQPPPPAYDTVHDAETGTWPEVAEGVILQKYIREELRTVLQEDYALDAPDEDEESFTGIEKVDYIIDDLQKRNILHLLDSQEERGAFLKWIVGEYIDDILPEDLHDLMRTVLRGHTEREDEEDEAHHDEREDELFDDLEAALDYEQEEEIELAGELDEVYSQKQRRWACAQKDKPAEKRKKGLSKKEADEMCKSKELKKKKPKRGKK